jgi:hypothetical protein
MYICYFKYHVLTESYTFIRDDCIQSTGGLWYVLLQAYYTRSHAALCYGTTPSSLLLTTRLMRLVRSRRVRKMHLFLWIGFSIG